MSVTAAFVLAITVVAASTGSLIISAETNTYTVTFDTSGVVEIPPQTVSHGEFITKPAIPSPALIAEDGKLLECSVSGWYTSSGTGWTNWDFNTPITSDIVLHVGWATWEGGLGDVRVNFDTDGGSEIPLQNFADRYYVGATVEKPQDPTKEGFIFDGWHNKYWLSSYEYNLIPWNFDDSWCDVTYEPIILYPGTEYYSMMPKGGRWLYAKWTPDPNYTPTTTTTTTATSTTTTETTTTTITGSNTENLTSTTVTSTTKSTTSVIIGSNATGSTSTTATTTTSAVTTKKSNSNAPKTGDDSIIVLLYTVCGLSAITALTIGLKQKSKD